MPEAVRRLQEELEQSRIFRVVKRAFDAITEEHQEEYEVILQVVDKVRQQLHQDLSNLFGAIFETPAVLTTVDWVIRNYVSVSDECFFFFICLKN